ncbi:LysR family transcriptional regulator [Acaryochloris sp. IP29b_bin.137]|uniref:LysR family transcriptional regulator n=1 Tax=Acaryochloris sp. IP29b_bin.137 TaxID=2969217 RepID=UPI00261B652B|nr:LysR family transcriptional regulator [Acaryochloris sp. IP29b_bin.137]
MKLFQLRAALAVADWGNFSEAALQLELSQPAVSHAITTLEDELGVPLFIRGRRGATLTPAGTEILAHAHQVLNHLEQMQAEAHRQRGLQGGTVRIATFRSAATHILPKAIAQFRRSFPNIHVTMLERPDNFVIEQCLREGQADLGVTFLPTSNDFDVWELLQDEYLVLMPPHQSLPQPITWKDIGAFSPIQLTDAPCSRSLQHHLQKFAPSLETIETLQEDSTLVSMVSQGLVPAILPRLAAEPIPPEITVHPLPDPYARKIGIAMRSNSLYIPAVYAFLDLLKQTVSKK